jgi:F-type H+-transporting ATPase subunit epsilon
MAETLKLEIVTPEGVAFSDGVDIVTLPAVEGEMGIYPQHAPLLTQVVPGEVIARKGDQEFALAVGEGFVEITGDRVLLLTDLAVSADADEAEAEAARKRAEARMRERISDEEVAVVEAAIQRTMSQVKARRRHPRHH